MKAIYLFIVIFSIPLISVAQELNIKELSALIFADYDDYETTVLKRGFKFDKVENEETDEHDKVKRYHHYKFFTGGIELTNYESTTYDFISLTIASITYTTTIVEKFVKLKEQIKSNGYKLTKAVEVPNDNKIFNFYNNPEVNVTIATSIHGGDSNSYTIRFSFNPSQKSLENLK